jgi:nitrite reductase/ring-hydroxylating ferredoxin subunit
MPSTQWIKATTLDDLPTGSALEFTHDGRVYALFRVGDAITCIDGLCPHQAGRLANGSFLGSTVTCPRIGCLRWSFDVTTGSCALHESLTRRLYPVRVEGRAVLVALPGP